MSLTLFDFCKQNLSFKEDTFLFVNFYDRSKYRVRIYNNGIIKPELPSDYKKVGSLAAINYYNMVSLQQALVYIVDRDGYIEYQGIKYDTPYILAAYIDPFEDRYCPVDFEALLWRKVDEGRTELGWIMVNKLIDLAIS